MTDDLGTYAENTWCPGCGNFAILNAVKTAMDNVAAAAGVAAGPVQTPLRISFWTGWKSRSGLVSPLPVPVTQIGQIVEGDEMTLVFPDGRRERLTACGWEHRT